MTANEMALLCYLAVFGVIAIVGIVWGAVKLHNMEQDGATQS